ncbi:UNVERIFIED_CONTAM: hypothetical protein HDU68_004436 [Siphonaria sp. JEL0065]|nr:hypothetical protein HDU68_004436 [Siphonaria sp. JEL0065]
MVVRQVLYSLVFPWFGIKLSGVRTASESKNEESRFIQRHMLSASLIVTLALLAPTAVFAQTPTANLQTGCVTNYDASFDYFPEKIDSASLTNLAYTYSKNYKTIVNKFSNETIVLYQCGTPKPTVEGATQIIAVPIQNVTIGSTTVVTYLELLGLRNVIKYTAQGTSGYISSPCAQALVASGAITEVDTKNLSTGIQQVQSTGVYLHYMDTLAANVTNAVSFPASADPGVKGRAEWLGFIGSLFNQEAKANNIASAIAVNYAQLAAATHGNHSSLVVAWIEYQSAFGPKYPATWKLSAHQYQLDLTKSAGATLLLPNTTTATTVTGATSRATVYSYTTSESLLSAIATADIVIDLSFYNVNMSDFTSSFAISASNTNTFKFLTNKQVYMVNKEIGDDNGGNNWFEEALVLQHLVLADLVSVVHPTLLDISYKRKFLRNAFGEGQTVLSDLECVDLNAGKTVPLVKLSATTNPKDSGVVVGFTSSILAVVCAIAFFASS